MFGENDGGKKRRLERGEQLKEGADELKYLWQRYCFN